MAPTTQLLMAKTQAVFQHIISAAPVSIEELQDLQHTITMAAQADPLISVPPCPLDTLLDFSGQKLTVLYCAAQQQRTDVAALLLGPLGASPEYPPEIQQQMAEPPLHVAVSTVNVDLAKLLVDRGADPKRLDSQGQSCADRLAQLNQRDDVPAGRISELSALLFGVVAAAATRRDEVAALEAAADPSALDRLQAAVAQFPDLAKAVLQRADDVGPTTLLMTAAWKDNGPAAAALLAAGAEPMMPLPDTFNTALHVACFYGAVNVVQEFVNARKGLDTMAENSKGEACLSVLHTDVGPTTAVRLRQLLGMPPHVAIGAARTGDVAALQEFLKYTHVDSPLPVEGGRTTTLVNEAAQAGCLGSLQFLLQHEAGPDGPHATVEPPSPASPGSRVQFNQAARVPWDTAVLATLPLPLVAAAQGASPKLASYCLLEFGATVRLAAPHLSPAQCDVLVSFDASVVPPCQQAVLHCVDRARAPRAALLSFISCLSPVDLNRAEPTETLGQTETPEPLLIHASRHGNDRAVSDLIAAGCDVDVRDSHGCPALVAAASGRHRGVVEALLLAGADPAAVDADGADAVKASGGAMKTVIDRALQDRAQAVAAEYATTMDQRFDQDARAVRAKAPKSVTPASVVAALRQAASQAVDKIAASLVPTGLESPFTSLLIAGVKEAVTKKIHALGLHDLVQVPLPRLLPWPLKEAIGLALVPCWAAIKPPIMALLPPSKPVAPGAPLEEAQGLWDVTTGGLSDAFAKSVGSCDCHDVARYYATTFVWKELLKGLSDCTDIDDLKNHPVIAAGGDTKKLLAIKVPPAAVKAYGRSLSHWRSTPLDPVRLAVGQLPATGKLEPHLKLITTALLKVFSECAKKAVTVALEQLPGYAQGPVIVQRYAASCYDATEKALREVPSTPQYMQFPFPGATPLHHMAVKAICDARRFTAFVKEVRTKDMPQPGCTPVAHALLKQKLAAIESTAAALPQPGSLDGFESVFADLVRQLRWSRMPIYSHLDDIDKAMARADVVLIEADTGSGKSVLLPQHLARRTQTWVTMPRVLPVLKTSEFVKSMMPDKTVGFQAGSTPNPNPKAMLQYVTDETYARTVLRYPHRLPNGSVLILDEVHERTAATDAVLLSVMQLIKSGDRKGVKIVLTSATVDPQWFKTNVAAFGLSFEHMHVPVASPHPVTVNGQAMKDTLQRIASGDAPTPDWATMGATDAFTAVQSDPKARVLVFLPDVSRVTTAQSKFNAMAGGKVDSGILHASVTDPLKVTRTSRVIFANQVAESSITIDGLTHVFDSLVTMKAEVERDSNCRTLAVAPISAASHTQRKGRLGRTCPGTYTYYGDLSQLAPSPVSVDLLLNDTALALELRFRQFLGRSLMAGTPKALGSGYDLTSPSGGCTRQLPPWDDSQGSVQWICASFSVGPGMATALKHAADNSLSCARALLLVACFLGSHQHPTAHNTALGQYRPPAPHNRFGDYGDTGLLLDLHAEFVACRDAARAAGTHFVPAKWASTRHLNEHFFDNVSEHVSWMERPANVMSLRAASGYNLWKWSDIEDCLVKGYWHQLARKVDTKLRGPHHAGPYMLMDNEQLIGLDFFRNSSYFKPAPGTTMPQYLLFDHLHRGDRKGRRFMTLATAVSAAAVKKWADPAGQVTQSIALWNSDFHTYEAVYPSASYPGCTIETDPTKFTQHLLTKRPSSGQQWGVEFQCKGTRTQVAAAMEAVAADIDDAFAKAKLSSGVPNTVGAFGKPGITEAELRQAGMTGIADRLLAATMQRSDADLRAAMHSGDKMKAILAVVNFLVRECKWSVKGGVVRDVIVRGRSDVNDFDCEVLDGATYTLTSWPGLFAAIQKRLTGTFGLACAAPVPRAAGASKGTGIVAMDLQVQTLGKGCDLEAVMPWNDQYLPVKNMDLSCNNLRIDPPKGAGSSPIGQTFTIMMTAQDIIAQLCVLPVPQTTPTRDFKWRDAQAGDPKEGMSRRRTAEATIGAMVYRLRKFRNKGFWYVEGPHVTSNQSVVLYHGTTNAAAQGIVAGGFRPSGGGMLGAGVYLSRDMRIVSQFASPAILEVVVNPGRVLRLSGYDPSGSWHSNADTAYLSALDSGRGMEEWCVADPKRITAAKRIN